MRKNPDCHPLIRAALINGEGKSAAEELKFELLIELAWQARRCGLDTKQTLKILEEWLAKKASRMNAENLAEMSVEQAKLLLEVLAAKLGEGPMPSKSRIKKP